MKKKVRLSRQQLPLNWVNESFRPALRIKTLPPNVVSLPNPAVLGDKSGKPALRPAVGQ